MQFAGENAKNFSEFTDGFKPANDNQTVGVSVPGCVVGDDLTRDFGDPDEGMFAAALQYREDGSCPTVSKSKQSTLARARKAGDVEVEVPTGFAFEGIKIMRRH